jgi:hypothetical protein
MHGAAAGAAADGVDDAADEAGARCLSRGGVGGTDTAKPCAAGPPRPRRSVDDVSVYSAAGPARPPGPTQERLRVPP